ncbi:MAG: chromate resistance protein [Gammaproteobacteria bacterium]|nr:chromate resistance protein [Gammaproteobacteria bacterium]
MKPIEENRWAMLVISLPGRSATPRMRVWRALKALGTAVLRDGVYLLPDGESTRPALEAQAREVVGAGGTAHVLRVDGVDPEQTRRFRALFDRDGDYSRVTEAARRLRSLRDRRKLSASVRTLKRLRREYQAIRATDYFAGSAADQAAQMLTDAEASLNAQLFPGEPRMQTGRIERLAIKDYRHRTWATRARPWVDRLASAWLIKRFIDPPARILWLKDIKRCPGSALGFDFDGATFSHVGARVTFETLLASFGLEDDPALQRLGRLVHCLDVGGAPVPEAQGLAAILAGARARLTNDNRLLAEASRLFDHLYRSYQEE